MHPFFRHPFLLTALVIALRAPGQWFPLADVPDGDVPSLITGDDGVLAGTELRVHRGDVLNGFQAGGVLPGAPVFIDALFTHDGQLYAGTGGNGIFLSGDAGASWQNISQGLTGMGSQYVSDLAVLQDELFCATMGAGVFKRTVGAWAPFGGLGTNITANVAFVREVNGSLWAGAGANGHLWRLDPGAGAFAPVQVGPLQVDPFVLTDLIAVGNELLVGSTYGVYRSTDGGATWTPVSAGPPGGERVRFLHVGNVLFTLVSGTTSRLYRSYDEGQTWDLVDVMPTTYAIAHHTGRLYAARTDGLWMRDDLGLGQGDAPEVPSLHCHPNPATDAVQLEVPWTGTYLWTLRDLAGRAVAQGTGAAPRTELQVHWIPAGTYVIEVNDGAQHAAQRLVVH